MYVILQWKCLFKNLVNEALLRDRPHSILNYISHYKWGNGCTEEYSSQKLGQKLWCAAAGETQWFYTTVMSEAPLRKALCLIASNSTVHIAISHEWCTDSRQTCKENLWKPENLSSQTHQAYLRRDWGNIQVEFTAVCDWYYSTLFNVRSQPDYTREGDGFPKVVTSRKECDRSWRFSFTF